MPNGDFYILKQSDPTSRLKVLTKLAEKAWRSGQRTCVYTDDPAQVGQIDRWLWSYRANSFLPHSTVAAGLASPVEISGDAPPEHRELLINLAVERAPWADEFARILEIVIQEELVLESTRDHYRHYREQGRELKTHQL